MRPPISGAVSWLCSSRGRPGTWTARSASTASMPVRTTMWACSPSCLGRIDPRSAAGLARPAFAASRCGRARARARLRGVCRSGGDVRSVRRVGNGTCGATWRWIAAPDRHRILHRRDRPRAGSALGAATLAGRAWADRRHRFANSCAGFLSRSSRSDGDVGRAFSPFICSPDSARRGRSCSKPPRRSVSTFLGSPDWSTVRAAASARRACWCCKSCCSMPACCSRFTSAGGSLRSRGGPATGAAIAGALGRRRRCAIRRRHLDFFQPMQMRGMIGAAM